MDVVAQLECWDGCCNRRLTVGRVGRMPEDDDQTQMKRQILLGSPQDVEYPHKLPG